MKRFAAVLAVSAFAAALVLLLSFTAFFEGLGFLAYDFTMRLAGPVRPEAPVTLLAIDEASLNRIGRWPWKREQLAALVDGVAHVRPAVLVLDLMLDDAESETGDAALAGAMARVSRVVLPARIVSGDNGDHWEKPQLKFLLPNVSLGHVHTEPDLDNTSRRVYSAKAAEGSLVPALSIAALEAYGASIDPAFRFGRNPDSRALNARTRRSALPEIPAGLFPPFPRGRCWKAERIPVSSKTGLCCWVLLLRAFRKRTAGSLLSTSRGSRRQVSKFTPMPSIRFTPAGG